MRVTQVCQHLLDLCPHSGAALRRDTRAGRAGLARAHNQGAVGGSQAPRLLGWAARSLPFRRDARYLLASGEPAQCFLAVIARLHTFAWYATTSRRTVWQLRLMVSG